MLEQNLFDEKFDSIDLDNSQLKQYLNKFDTDQNNLSLGSEGIVDNNLQLQNLIVNNLTLEYDIFLDEEELKFYKNVLNDKEHQIKRLKEMYNKKNNKITAIVQTTKRLKKKIKETSQGYHSMMQKKQEFSLKQQKLRNQRLTCQEEKSQLYQKYCELQDIHKDMKAELENYEGFEIQFKQISSENQQLREAIEELEQKQQLFNGQAPNNRKEQLKNEIKKLFQKIKNAEKDQTKIIKQYETSKKKQKSLQEQQNAMTQRNLQLNTLYIRISELKDEIKHRKWSKLQKQKQYHELLTEESKLKRQLALQQSRYKKNLQKPNYMHNFKIIDSQADQQYNQFSRNMRSSSHKQNSNASQDQMDDLIDRFQKLKSKSKNLT